MQSEQTVFVTRCIILFLFFTKSKSTFNHKEDLIFWRFHQISPNQQKSGSIQSLIHFYSANSAWLFGGSCWTRYWGCTSLVCKWHGWCCLFSFAQNSCSGTFRFIWYSNFMNCNSPISFIFDRYMSSLIIVYLENTHLTYHCVCVCLFIFLLWSSVQNRDNPTPKFMAYIHYFPF